MLAWIRQHPVRIAVYALLVAGAVWAGLTVRGVLRGERNELLTSIARAPLARDFVERQFHIRYSLDSVALVPKCGMELEVRGANVELEGAASGGLDSARVCVSGSGELHGIRVGDKLVTVQTAQFDWPKSISGTGFSWRDRNGEMVSAGAFTASPNDVSGGLQSLRVLAIASVDSASATLAPLVPPAITIKTAAARGINVDVDTTAIAQAPARLQAAANVLQAMGAATLPLPTQWLETVRKLLVQVLIGAAILLLIIKALLTRAPATIGWRIAAILAPFAAFPLLALTNLWLAIVIAAPVLAIALWALAYRHAAQWHQRWEPAAVDIPAVLLALLLMVLWHWPKIPALQIPAIDHVTVAQADVQDVTATVHQPTCGPSSTVHVSVPQAGVRNLQVALDGGTLKSIDMQLASAHGSVQSNALDDLRHINYLPAAWKTNPPVPFCAAVTLRNSGAAGLPEAACVNPVGANVRAAVDYGGQGARFAADWNSAPAAVAVTGSANLQGAQIDDIHTKPGGPVRISHAAAQVAWPKGITASVQVGGVEASGVTIDKISVEASAPMPCSTGAIHVAGDLGTTRYSFSGNDIRLDSAGFNFVRLDSGSFSAKIHSGQLSLKGAVETSIPEADFLLDGITSREPIPQTLTGRALFNTAAVSPSGPIEFAANLWTADWQLPHQSLTIRQQVTSRIPQALALTLQASGGISSARGQVEIPRLSPDIGPTALELNGLHVDGGWDSGTGLAPVNISTGWNIVKIPAFPTGIQFNDVSSLHLKTSGEALEAPVFDMPQFAMPAFPPETKFRLQGTPQSIAITLDGGEQITLDHIATRNFRASFPGLKLGEVELDTSAQVTRNHSAFPLEAHTRLSDTSLDTVLAQPLGATLSMAPQALSFAINRPLDTAKLLNQIGLSIDGIQLQTTLTGLAANVNFSGTKLAGLDVAGTLAAGPLASGKNFEVSQRAPTTFHVAAPELPKLAVSASAPGIDVKLNGGKQHLSAAADVGFDLTLATAPQSPLFTQLREAATGLSNHAQKAGQVFAAEDAAVFPLSWDVEVTGGSPTVSFGANNIAINANTLLRRVDIGQETIDGTVDLHAAARLDDGHLLFDLNAPADIGALGRRWQIGSPLLIVLSKELRPGTGGALFDSVYYGNKVAIGYGDALQVHATFQQPFTSGTIGGLAQAAIRWPNGAASVDSFGTVTFRGLEAGAFALPTPYLEDRLDGDVTFSTKGFLADRLLVPQLLADASRIRQLDNVDFSVQVRSAADGAHLPGTLQAASGITLKPADQLIKILTRNLNLTMPPRALQYRNMALDFRVEHGLVQTEPVLLTLSGVQIFGVQGLTLDSKVRILWGGHGREPAPRLRDLIYTFQRAMER
jgi:hypothetical protein